MLAKQLNDEGGKRAWKDAGRVLSGRETSIIEMRHSVENTVRHRVRAYHHRVRRSRAPRSDGRPGPGRRPPSRNAARPRVPGAGTTPVVPPSAADAWGDARRDWSSRAPQRQAGLGKERGTQVLRGILTDCPRSRDRHGTAAASDRYPGTSRHAATSETGLAGMRGRRPALDRVGHGPGCQETAINPTGKGPEDRKAGRVGRE